MDEYLALTWAMILDREYGLFHLRLLIQPLVAAALAVRAGVEDARAQRPPFGWAILVGSGRRPTLLREGWKDVPRIFLAALAIDSLYRVIVCHWFYIGQALIVAAVLSVPSYLLVRGPVNRAATLWFATRTSGKPNSD